MAQGDLYEAQVRMNVANNPSSFCLGYRETTSTPPANADSTAALSIAVNQDILGLRGWLSEQATLEGTWVRALSGDPQPPSKTLLAQANGTVTGDALPLTKAVLINHRQQEASIRSNGKTYLPGFPEAGVDGNSMPNDLPAGVIKDVFDSLLTISTNIQGDIYSFEMVVLKKAPGGGPPQAAYLVTSNSVPLTIYNQRRRRTREFGASGIAD